MMEMPNMVFVMAMMTSMARIRIIIGDATVVAGNAA